MMKYLSFFLLVLCFLALPSMAKAQEVSKIGMHILQTEEVAQAKQLVNQPAQDETWHYVTIPLVLADLKKPEEWQKFMDLCREQKVIPIVRLSTEYESGSWQVPTQHDVVEELEFLGQLFWPTRDKHVIVYNEPNHAKEWGGQIDPEGYGQILEFATNWAHTEQNGFVILPAAMDLAAPNGSQTREAFSYWQELNAHRPDALSQIDLWNSHSYPNPGFSAPAYRTDKQSIKGYEHELSWLKETTGRDLPVFITETGWEENSVTRRHLTEYYQYALENVWSDERVRAVTPFVLSGSPGPFSKFSFLDEKDQPTRQSIAMQTALQRLSSSDQLSLTTLSTTTLIP